MIKKHVDDTLFAREDFIQLTNKNIGKSNLYDRSRWNGDNTDAPDDLMDHLKYLTDELENFQDIAKYINPDPGEIPGIEGIDIHGISIPYAGSIGGDHIIYLDFNKRYDLDARIEAAEKVGRDDVVKNLLLHRLKAGIMLADVSGHRITDAMLTAMLHQAFLVGALYELDNYGKLTTRLFENLNNRFYKSSSVRKFVTMIYGEISRDGAFRFLSAGHPPPVIFSREFGHFVDIHPDHLQNFPPIGTMPSKIDVDIAKESSVLGYKDRYEVNELRLMSSGDILLLYTDGLSEFAYHGKDYFPALLESKLRELQDLTARDILEGIKNHILDVGSPDDDLSFVIIKKN